MKIQLASNPYQVEKRHSPIDQKDSIWNRDLSMGTPMKLKDKVQWYELLSTLIQSGLRILESLEILEEQLSKKKLKLLVGEMRRSLEAGVSLSESLKLHPDYFSEFEVQSIYMGEQTGKLGEVLKSLATFYRQRLKLQRKVVQALSYPMTVIVIALLVLAFMLNFVVPMFQDIFARFDAELPAVTKAVLTISAAFQTKGLWIMGFMAILSIGLWSLRLQIWLRKWTANILLRVPLVGKLYLKLQLARMCYSLGLMLGARVNLDQALSTTRDLVSFYPLEVALGEIECAVLEGSTLAKAISKHHIFPSYVQQIIRVGEQTARQGEMIARLATQLEEESQNEVNQLTQFIEPVLILCLGSMVAIILVSMYLPMFELGNAVM